MIVVIRLARRLQVGLIQVGPKGLELVLNEATQRKSASAAGFTLQVRTE